MRCRARSSALTDTGMRRSVNEDAYLQNAAAGVWVVADGMGGHSRGAVASRFVVDAFGRLATDVPFEAKIAAAHECIQAANDRVYGESKLLEQCAIMGSTVAALVVQGQRFAALWAGDSRAYHCRDGHLQQISRDHSVAQQLVDAGKLRASEAANHPTAHRITRAVGARATVQVDEYRGLLDQGDRLLLCSDGLTAEVDEVEIATLLTEFRAQDAAAELMALALERGARDNVTVLVLDFEPPRLRQRKMEDSAAVAEAVVADVGPRATRSAACVGLGS